MQLVIGNKAFSTWSLRPWLVLKRCGAEFSETVVQLYGEGYEAGVRAVSPSGKVPVLKVDGETVWDSMAICVWAAERYPKVRLWPTDAHARWLARSVTCEMHSAFMALRSECGMGPDHTMVGPDRSPAPASEAVASDVRRLVEIFRTMRARFGGEGEKGGGPFLFGEWSIPDAFFTPVATRIRHYQIDLAAHGDTDGVAQAYVETLLAQPDFLEWSQAGLEEIALR